MPNPFQRRRPRVRLTVSEVNAPERSVPTPELPLVPMALAGGALSVLVGVLLVTGLVMAGWFTAMAMPLSTALAFAGQLWLSAHGLGAVVGGVSVTLIPLGLTAVLLLVVRMVAHLVFRATASEELDGSGSWRAWGLFTVGYALATALIAIVSGSAPQAGWALIGGAVVSALGCGWALFGRLRGQFRLPAALDGLGKAVLAGVGTMTVVAAAVLLIGLLLGAERVSLIEQSLAPDAVGAWLLVALQLLYLPNLLAWTASWTLGAGISVGTGSFVSPILTTAGVLPAIPALGAVPPAGAGGPWSYAWLASGVVVGAVAGWAASALRRYRGGLPLWLARGAGAGLGTAAVVVGLGLLSRGDLGVDRLVGLGPIPASLALLAPAPMLLGGVLAAAVHWLLRGRHLNNDVSEEPTESLDTPTESLDTVTVTLNRD